MTMTFIDILAPELLLKQWRDEGLSPAEIRAKSDEFITRIKINKSPVKPQQARGSKFPPADELYGLYQKHPMREVARMIGSSTERVRQILKAGGYPTNLRHPRPSRRRSLPVDKIREMVQAGVLIRDIAREIGVSHPVLSRCLKEKGIKKPCKVWGQCPNCKTRPIARGMCNACLTAWYRAGKPGVDI